MGAARDLGPVGSARLLRSDLRRARETAGRTQAELAEQLGWSTSKLTRIESGEVGITASDLRTLGSALELGPAVVAELVRRAETARRRGWWHEYRADIPQGYVKLLGLEVEADQINEFTGTFVPGLLQTQRYADALFHAIGPLTEPERVALMVAIRMRRQIEFFQVRDPPEMRTLLDESTLYRRIGDHAVMAEQIGRLAELARRPQLSLRILPFESSVVWSEAFVVLRNAATGNVVYSESHFGDLIIEDRRALEQFERLFALLWQDALDPDRTGQLLHRAASAYAGGRDPRPWLWE